MPLTHAIQTLTWHPIHSYSLSRPNVTLKLITPCPQPRVEVLIAMHISLVSIAWLFCAPLALAVARFRHTQALGKLLSSTYTRGQVELWFLLHRWLLLLAVGLSILAGALAACQHRSPVVQAHHVLGWVTIGFSSMQAIPTSVVRKESFKPLPFSDGHAG